jgi:hypothetical protein
MEGMMPRMALKIRTPEMALLVCLASGMLCGAPSQAKNSTHLVLTGAVQSPAGRAQTQPRKSLDYFVASDGKDSNDGSQMHPWATITHAAKVAGPGATVHVMPGTYREVIVTAASGTLDARVKYVSEKRWRAIIAPETPGTFVWQNTGDYTDIIGFDLSGAPCNGIGLGGSHQRAIENNVHNSGTGCSNSHGGSGINSYAFTASDNDIIANYVHDVGADDSLCGDTGHRTVQGIYQSNRGGHIVENLVVHNCVFGIQLWHAATNGSIINNTVVHNLGGGILVGTGDAPCNTGGCPGGDDYTIVRNNIVAFNGNPQLKGWGIVESSGDVGIHNQYSNNLSYQNASGDFAFNHHLTCENCIEGKDPGFIDASSGDFHLQRTSPAVGHGIKRDSPETDFDNEKRLQSETVDIGAFELGAHNR